MIVQCPIDPTHSAITPFSSRNEMYCHECRTTFPWILGENKIPLVSNNRATRTSPMQQHHGSTDSQTRGAEARAPFGATIIERNAAGVSVRAHIVAMNKQGANDSLLYQLDATTIRSFRERFTGEGSMYQSPVITSPEYIATLDIELVYHESPTAFMAAVDSTDPRCPNCKVGFMIPRPHLTVSNLHEITMCSRCAYTGGTLLYAMDPPTK